MTQRILNIVCFSIVFIQFCACTSLGKIPIQVALPAKYKISPNIRSIVVLNRSMNAHFLNYRHDLTENLLRNLKSPLEDYLDSTASDSAVIVAAKVIFDSQRFDVVVPYRRNVCRDVNYIKWAPLDTNFVIEICRNFKVDALLVLESFSERASKSFWKPWRRVIGRIDLRYNSIWDLCSPGKSLPLLSMSANDVLSWTGGFDNSHREGFSPLPSLKKMLITGGIESGLNIASQICPNWADETRYYYITGDKNIDEAIPLIKSNKWEDAKEIWIKYAEVSSKSLRSRIENNLAVASEMTGDLDQAVEWYTKSLKTKYSRNTNFYLKYLGERRSAIAKSRV